MSRLIIFLIRIKLGLKKYQKFNFCNQKDKKNEVYYFTATELIKVEHGYNYSPSGVSLNWLLNKNCRIDVVKEV